MNLNILGTYLPALSEVISDIPELGAYLDSQIDKWREMNPGQTVFQAFTHLVTCENCGHVVIEGMSEMAQDLARNMIADILGIPKDFTPTDATPLLNLLEGLI